ncbi:MAG: N-acetylmuramoyl-L-alanine amidase [Flavobacteriales bacterium]|nr:N-acetylmuramoyl-L-alanine amidase [Flavobacteriales bacterium]
MKKWTVLLLLLLSAVSFSQKTAVTILIDPGHGGEDPGHLPTTDSLKQEKYLSLEIAQKVGSYLLHNLNNVNVMYTRTEDVAVSLDERVDMANNNEVDYMLSIHINGYPNSSIRGTETHIHSYDAKDSYKWAKYIEGQFKNRAGRKSRGVKTIKDLGHSLQVLKYTKMPTVLVECGFITNQAEGKYLNTVYGQEIIASAIFRATREFLQYKHPAIDFIPKEEDVVVEDEPYYMVQIMASIDSISTDIPELKKLNKPIQRKYVESSSIYRYKYYVGPYTTKKEAKKAQKEVQDDGYKDAFLIFYE